MEPPRVTYFNPTLVRLGPLRAPPHPPLGARFQSHFGSIGAWLGPATRWFPAPFQSHFGSIGASLFVCRNRGLAPISIPLWFDWGNLTPHEIVINRPHFNPTLVRLGLAGSAQCRVPA